MQIHRVALGAITSRGSAVAKPSLVTLAGPAEMDFLGRHVQKVRANDQARAIFIPGAIVPALLASLASATDADFITAAEDLQSMLAATMAHSTNASGCVTALVHAQDQGGGADHLTVLKLDANVEAAQRDIFQGVVNLVVLTELLPTPRDLQKGMSWPDGRSGSEALVVDSNSDNAQYFEKAFQLQVSPKSSRAVQELHRAIVDAVPQADLPRVLNEAAKLDGPVDSILSTLATRDPSLQQVIQQRAATASTRPSGIVPRNKIAALPVIWRADGVELRVPGHLADMVKVTQQGTRYELSIVVDSQPHKGS